MSNTDKPGHHPQTQFPSANGELLIGGIGLTRIAQRIGSDSFYAYDRQLIAQRITELKAKLPANIGIHYAIKANPFAPLVCFIASQIDGLDVASATEMRLALDAGMAPAHISFAGPGKTEADLTQAVAAGILLNIESAQEAETLATISHRSGQAARVALRINPAFELRSSGMRMGGGSRPFGVDEESAPALLKRIGALGLAFEGFHIYAG
ncbi:MAG TPA: pyridoxal-dependent decarboxylase, exosortase A system-associated, partial [Rhodocyclaceae bacterium]|nr:pyridoxal-dependent decarboxylase, exosortase A system-associated [Rhodocyclaceae bacterium]